MDHYHPTVSTEESNLSSIKRSAGAATRGESAPLHPGHKTCKQGIHPGFETQGRRHRKSKTGVSVVSQKGLLSSENFKN